MKKLTMMALTALLMFNTVPVFALETPQEQYLCKLQAGNCLKQADVVQRKMKKIETDVQKGSKTYSADDLKMIEQKLKEVEQMLDELKAK